MAKKEIDVREVVFYVAFFLGVTGTVAGIISSVVVRDIKEKKTQRVNKQVEAYEKTLPGYLEQKQVVEHYRDSLMNIDVR